MARCGRRFSSPGISVVSLSFNHYTGFVVCTIIHTGALPIPIQVGLGRLSFRLYVPVQPVWWHHAVSTDARGQQPEASSRCRGSHAASKHPQRRGRESPRRHTETTSGCHKTSGQVRAIESSLPSGNTVSSHNTTLLNTVRYKRLSGRPS